MSTGLGAPGVARTTRAPRRRRGRPRRPRSRTRAPRARRSRGPPTARWPRGARARARTRRGGPGVGARRIEILAAALADRVLEALSIDVASMPIVVIDGLFHRRRQDRAGADERDAVEQAGLGAEPLPRRSRCSAATPSSRPGHRDVAIVVVERGEQAHESGDGVGGRATEHAGVHRVVEGLDPDDDANPAAERRRQGRRADGPVAGVGDDDGVGSEPVAVLLEDRAGSEGEPDSSSPSTKTVTPTGRLPAWARSAATCAMTPALSSAAPRP